MVSMPMAKPAIARPGRSQIRLKGQASVGLTKEKHWDIHRSALDGGSNHKNNNGNVNRELAPDSIGNRSIDQRSSPGSYSDISLAKSE